MSPKSIDIDPPPSVEFKRAGPNGKTPRVMSTSMVAAYFNVSRNTVLAWKRDGCPVEREATKKAESDQLDIADVISWHFEMTAIVADDPGSPEHLGPIAIDVGDVSGDDPQTVPAGGSYPAGTRLLLTVWTTSGDASISGLVAVIKRAA